MKKVLLCQDIHDAGRRLLEKDVEVVVAPDYQEETIRSLIPEFHGVIIRTAGKITKEIIEAGVKLEVIARTGAGVDNVDVEAATGRGIPICYAPEANFTSVAEHTIALILALAKQLPVMDRAVREGQFKIRYEYLPVDVTGKTIGIVGFGRIGKEVARRCIGGLGMNVLWYDPYLQDRSSYPLKEGPYAEKTEPAEKNIRRMKSLPVLLGNSDFVSVHLPHNIKTHHMFGKGLIEKMRPTTYFINTSRGAVVDEAALVDALDKKKIAGAGLDVYENEPPDVAIPLLKLPNVILTPHSAALTKECVARMAVDSVQGVVDVFEGRRPKFIFNRGVYERS
jgi:D-3-phosphoglycerate dehydrogenase